MGKNRVIGALSSILIAACGGSAVTTQSATTPATNGGTDTATETQPAAPRYPFLADALVRQTLPSYATPSVHVLTSGAAVLVSENLIVVTDERFRVIRRIPIPAQGVAAFRAVDPAGHFAVTAQARVDLANGNVVANDGARIFAACDADLHRCVTFERGASAYVHVRLEDGTTGTELEAFDVTYDALSGQPLGNRVPPAFYGVHGASLLGSRLAFATHVPGPTQIVVYDLAAHAVVASRTLRDASSARIELVADGTKALLSDGDTLELVDASEAGLPSRATVRGALLPNASSAEKIVVRGSASFDVYDRATLARSGDALDALPLLGATGMALVSGSEVRFLGSDGQQSATVPGESLPVEALMGSATYAPSGVYAWGGGGLLHVAASDAAARFVGLYPEQDHFYFSAGEDHFVMRMRRHVLSLGGDGIMSRTREEADAQTPPSMEPSSRFEAVFPGREFDLVGIAGPERQGVAFAYVERGQVHVTDAEGHDVVRAVRLPGAVARSGCSELAFISDVDLALAGGAPCIPTRIRFRANRTEPLGRAYVAIDSTPDGARVAMMADRKIHVVDGRTGEDLLTLDPQLEHPRSIGISDDGQVLTLFGVGLVVVDLRALGTPGATPEVARYDQNNVAYAAADNRIVVCAEGKVRVETPFAGEDEASESPAQCDTEYGGAWSVLPGFAAVQIAPTKVLFVRLRDAATLEVEGVDANSEEAVVVSRADEVIGVFPSASHLFAVRAADGTLGPLPADDEGATTAVRAFFAAPAAP